MLPRPPAPPRATVTSWPGRTRSKRVPSQRVDLRAGRHADDHRLAVGPVPLGALPVPAALGAEVRPAAERLQVAQVVVAAQHDVAAAAAVAAVGTALRDVGLAPEGQAAVAARSRSDLDVRAVGKHV